MKLEPLDQIYNILQFKINVRALVWKIWEDLESMAYEK